jgi:aminoglycoside 6'-N-acetyltransferase I
MSIQIRELSIADCDLWAGMRQALWPELSHEDHLDDIEWILRRDNHWAYVAIVDSAPVAFAEVALRDYANGCTGRPVPFLEGIWVSPGYRRQNIGAALIDYISDLFAAKGFVEICSDALIDNNVSHAAHANWGFAETERVVYFRKSLASDGGSFRD